jgi:uncharacterized membrane protein YoaK (UPF0700 family)
MKQYLFEVILTLLITFFIIGALIYGAFSLNFWLGIFTIIVIGFCFYKLYQLISDENTRYE